MVGNIRGKKICGKKISSKQATDKNFTTTNISYILSYMYVHTFNDVFKVSFTILLFVTCAALIRVKHVLLTRVLQTKYGNL